MEFLDEKIPFDVGLPVIGTSVVDVSRDRIQGELDDFTRSESLTLGYDFTHEFSENWTLNHGFRIAATPKSAPNQAFRLLYRVGFEGSAILMGINLINHPNYRRPWRSS